MQSAAVEPLATGEGPQEHAKIRGGLQAFEECRWLDAIACFRDVLAQNLEQYEVAGKLGFALSQAREYDEAIVVLRRLCENQPRSARWPYMVGYQFYMRGAWKQAIEWFDKALSLNPTYVKVLYRKAYAHFQLNQHGECITALNACIQVWQQLSRELQQAERKNYGKANFLLGKAHLARGLSLKARRPLQIAVEVDGDNPDGWYVLGKCHLKNGDIQGAIRELERANALRPGKDYVLDRLAQAYALQGNLKKAEDLYRKIPRQHQRSFILKNLGKLYLDQGRVKDALGTLQMAAKKDGANHRTKYLLGKALEANGHHRDAVLAYQSAIELKRRNFGKDFPDAETALQRLKDEMPDLIEMELTSGARQGQADRTGVVNYYDATRGFGFIFSGGQKIFFHVTAVADGRPPLGGETVSFQLEQSERGPRAVAVRIVDNIGNQYGHAKDSAEFRKRNTSASH